MQSYKQFIVGLLTIPLIGSTAYAQNNFKVSGEIKNWPTKYIHLVQRGDYPSEDSVVVNNGKFSFEGNIQGPTNAFLVAKQATGNKAIFFFVEPGDIKVNGDFNNFDQIDISGSPATDDFKIIKVYEAELSDNIKALNKSRDNNQITEQQFEDQLEGLYQKRLDQGVGFIRQHPKSSVSISELLNVMNRADKKLAKELFEGLSDELKVTPGGQLVSVNLVNSEGLELGTIAPDFSQPDVNGKIVKLSDYRGKYLLLDFWASWCAPCRAENPNLVAAYSAYKDHDFEILGVSIDDKAAEKMWKTAILSDKLTWTQVSDLKGAENEAALQYGITQIPTNYLLDKEGKIIAKDLRGEELQKKLKELLK